MDALSTREQDKYRRMWAVDAYRVRSIGSDLVHAAYSALGMRPMESLTDYGCGTGRAALAFAELGLRVSGIDIAENAIATEPAGRVRFLIASLWELPADQPATDWAYCTDVLEHIPAERVDDVLAAIAARTLRGAFLTISHRADRFGAVIGESLHLTVKPPAWWEVRLARAFGPGVRIATDGGHSEVAFLRGTA